MAAKILPWVLTALLSVAAPIVIYQVATAHGVAAVPALILSAAGPLLEMAITALVKRRLDEISTIILIAIVVGIATSLFFDDPKFLLLKESVLTGLLGVGYLVTLLTPRPAFFLLGRRFATGGDPGRVRWWNDWWRTSHGFRRTMRAMTAMWGLAFVVEAGVRVWLTYVLSIGTMVVINNIAPLAVVGLLMVITAVWGKRAQAAGARRAAAAEAAAQAPAPGDPQPV